MSRFLDPKLAKLAPYTPGEQPRGIQNLIKLNTNESPFPPSPAVLDAISRAQVENLRLYSDPTCDGFVRAIADVYGLAPDQVFPGNGSDEVLAFCFHGLCPRGAMFPDISYGFYPVFADMFGVKATVIPLREDFSISPADYAGQDGTVFIANPNAPTGLCLNLSQIRALLEQDRDRLVVVDEAYVDFGAESAAALLNDYANLLVVQTFSKSRQLAGARIGFALGSRELIADLNAMRFSFNPYNLNRLSLLAGEAAMCDQAYFERTRAVIMENRALTTARLRELGFQVLDSRANFIFARHSAIPGGSYYAALRQRSILVRHFDRDRIRDFVRITIGTAAQMDALLTATKDILKERNAL